MGAACAVCVVLAFLNQWLWFGMTAWAIFALAVAIGIGPASRRPRVAAVIVAMFVGYCALLYEMVRLYDPSGPPRIVLGFPISTALLVYGMAPVASIPAVLYVVLFDRWILPAERLERFRAEFGEGKPRA